MNRMTPSLASGHDVQTQTPSLGPAVPQNRGAFLHFAGRNMLRAAGWKLAGEIPNLPKFVVIVAPHTSNWDFVVGLAAKWALGMRVVFLGKDALFKPPLGWFMRALGGVPVHRQTANAMVERTAQEFAAREQLVLVLTPEGTRNKVDKWRSGFWHIARAADVPIVCATIDWGRREVRFGPSVKVNPDAEPAADIARIKQWYDDKRGFHPALQG